MNFCSSSPFTTSSFGNDTVVQWTTPNFRETASLPDSFFAGFIICERPKKETTQCHRKFPYLFPGEDHMKSLQAFLSLISFFMTCFLCCLFELLWLHYLWGIAGVLGKCLLSLDWGWGQSASSHVDRQLVFQPVFPWESLFPSQKSSAFTGGAKEFICQPHSSSQMLAGLLGICNLDCLGGKCGEWACFDVLQGMLRSAFPPPSISAMYLRSFLFCYHGLLLFHSTMGYCYSTVC